MTATTLLGELQTAGVIVTATLDGLLDLDAPRGVLTEAKLNALREYKTEIIAELRRRDEVARRRRFFLDWARDPGAWHEFETEMEERAAIMEIDGGLSRNEALTQAEIITYENWVT
jgi:TubC N-terminal docking domain